MSTKVSQVETLCCHQLNPSRKRFLRKCSPGRNQEKWLFINAIVLIWSVVLLTQIVGTLNENNESDEKTSVELGYLFYNLGTCFIWAVEVGLNIFDYIDTKEESGENSLLKQPDHSITSTSETTPLWIEFTFAVYSLIASVGIVFHLTRKEVHHLANGMLFDVFANMLAYLYMVYQQCTHWRKSNLGKEEETIISNREIV